MPIYKIMQPGILGSRPIEKWFYAPDPWLNHPLCYYEEAPNPGWCSPLDYDAVMEGFKRRLIERERIERRFGDLVRSTIASVGLALGSEAP